MATGNRGLGRGLDALFVDASGEAESASEILISEIEPDRAQPRRSFDESALAELAASISEHGVLQPILVRPLPSGGYKIVAGERRFRAAHLAGLTSIPALVKGISDREAIEIALVENLQREDLNPVEEALGYERLIEECGYTQEKAASRLGKSRASVTNALRILTLPEEVKQLLKDGKLTAGHAKALLSLQEPQEIMAAAQDIVSGGLSVREAERLSGKKKRTATPPPPQKTRESIAAEVELSLREALGVEVRVKYQDGAGTLSVDFYSKEQLFEFANLLGADK